MNETLLPNARLYAHRRQAELAESPGFGKDGIVLVLKNEKKAMDTAIKVFRFEEAHLREKLVYQRLAEKRITTVRGFNVPVILDFDDELRVIEMTIVKRPFVLDFAGAYLDSPPEFSDDAWTIWENEKREQFERRWPAAKKIMEEFEMLGIFLLDVTPGNIGFIEEAGEQGR
jgi:hypothetical protein